jgi:hypothetical protein
VIGDPTITVIVGAAAVVRATVTPKRRAEPRRSRIVVPETATVTPVGLAHTRTLGTVYVAPGPPGLTHARALGSPLVNPKLAPAGQAHTRAQGAPTVSPKLGPAGLVHTRAQGAPVLSPQIVPAGQVHTRALGALSLSAVFYDAIVNRATITPKRRRFPVSRIVVPATWTIGPAGITHTRGLGTVYVAPGPPGLAHTRALGSPVVNPQLAPAGQTRTRAQGSLTVTLAAFDAIVVRAHVQDRRRPAPKRSRIVVPEAATVTPTGQVHTRGQGTITVAIGWLSQPASLTRTRAQGSLTVNPKVAPAALTRTRVIGDPAVLVAGVAFIVRARSPLPQAGRLRRGSQILSGLTPTKGIAPAALTHTRAQGTLTISVRLAPTGLTRTRAQGSLTVTVAKILRPASHDRGGTYPGGYPGPGLYPDTADRRLDPPTVTTSAPSVLSGLVHTRAQGTPTVAGTFPIRRLGIGLVVTVAWVPRPLGLNRAAVSPTRTLGIPTVRGRVTLAPAALTRTRAQGTPVLSARILPVSQTRIRAQGTPSVNPRTISPAALTRTRAQGSHTVTLVRIIRPTGMSRTRTVGNITVHGKVILAPASLTRTRIQGTPVLSGRCLPPSLNHTRTQGIIYVNALRPLALARA